MNYDEIEKLNGKHFTLSQKEFFNSDAAAKVRMNLVLMDSDPLYNTTASYQYFNMAGLSFVDKHMLYLSQHPNVSHQHYLSNLRLKSKIRV